MTDRDEIRVDHVTVGELSRNIRDFRLDAAANINAVRSDTQSTIAKLETAVQDVRTAVAEAPYVHSGIFEEVRRAQGERLGELERDLIGLQQALSKANALAWGAIVSLVVSVTGAIIVAVVLAGLGR